MKRFTMFLAKLSLIFSILVISHVTIAGKIVISENANTNLKLKSQSYSGIQLENHLSEIFFQKATTPEGIFEKIIIPGYTKNLEYGHPLLPVKRELIEIPAGATAVVRIVSFNVSEYKLSDIGISRKLFPSQPEHSKSEDEHDFVYSMESYQINNFGEKEIVSVDDLGYLRGTRIGRVNIAPVKYNPVSNTLEVYENIVFEIEFQNADIAKTNEIKAKYFSPYFGSVKNQLINHLPDNSRENFMRYPIKYVIVSDPMFETQLEPFVEWKTKKGFTVIEAYTDDPNVGNTTSSIKAYLQDLYDNGTPEDPAPSFVLFVGDVAQVPAWSGNTGGHVTDLFYCEYTNDYFPEVYYGRFSAQNTDDLQPQIDKTLQYEKFEMPDPSYLDEVVLVAGMDGSYAQDWGNGQINYGTTNYFNPDHGLTSHTYLYPESGSHSADIIQHVSDGVAYGNYTAHCSAWGWADPAFGLDNVPGLENEDKYGLLVGNCCNSNEFDYGECFGEALLRAEDKGALGYIGGSNSTMWDPDYYWGVGVGTISENPPPYEETTLGAYDRTFHDHGEDFEDWYMTQDEMIYAGNLAVTEGTPNQAEYYWEIYCLMGDPSVMIYFSNPPTMTASYTNLLPIGNTTFTITTEPYAYGAISMDGVLHGAGLADDQGNLSLEIDPFTTPGTADVIVTGQNRAPYIGTVPVASPNGPYVIYDGHEVNDSQGNANALLDYGEDAYLTIYMENVGTEDAQDVEVTLSTDDDYVTVIDSTESYGTIAAGDSVSVADAFEVSIATDIPDGHIISFEITASGTSDDTWASGFTETGHAPLIAFINYSISDANGNNNGKLDPGETVDMTLEITNNGSSEAYNLEGELSSISEYIDIQDPVASFGNMPAGDTLEQTYVVTVDAATPTGHLADFEIALTGDLGITATGAFNTVVGQIPVLIVDFDGNTNSSPAMQNCFANLGVASEYATNLNDVDLALYTSVFVCLGIYSDNHALTADEGQALADYLNAGGNLYMEGGDTWAYDGATAVHPMFNIDGIEDGSNDLSQVSGQSGSFMEGMEYNYSGENSYIDHIAAIEPAVNLFRNDNPDYYCAVSYDEGTYKTVGSSFEFGGLDDGDYTKDEYMYEILNFFGIPTIWVGQNETSIPDDEVTFSSYPNPASNLMNIKLALKNKADVSLRVYDAVGQMVTSLKENAQTDEGKHKFSFDTQNLTNGIYYFELIVNNNRYINKIIIAH